MRDKLFLFLIIILALVIMGCTKPKHEFSSTLETRFSLGSEYKHEGIELYEDRIITINGAVESDMIKVYDYKGNLRDKFGNKGSGPNEILDPFRVWYHPENYYEVMDIGRWKNIYFGDTTNENETISVFQYNYYSDGRNEMRSRKVFKENSGFYISINGKDIHHLTLESKRVLLSEANPNFVTAYELDIDKKFGVIYCYDWQGKLNWKKRITTNAGAIWTNSKYIVIWKPEEGLLIFDEQGIMLKVIEFDYNDDRSIIGVTEEYLVWLDDSGEEETILEVHRIDD